LESATPEGLKLLVSQEVFGLCDAEVAFAAGLYSFGWLVFSILLFI